MRRLIDEDDVIRIVEFECGEWIGLARTIINGIKKIPCYVPDTNVGDTIYRQAAIDALMGIMDRPNHADFLYTDEICKTLNELPSAQPEPDWDYSKETKQITLIVPEDVYDSAETIFLSVGYEGTFGIRGMVYSVQPERKTGKWIVHYECPKCGEITKDFTEYCPFCSADMRGEQDETD